MLPGPPPGRHAALLPMRPRLRRRRRPRHLGQGCGRARRRPRQARPGAASARSARGSRPAARRITPAGAGRAACRVRPAHLEAAVARPRPPPVGRVRRLGADRKRQGGAHRAAASRLQQRQGPARLPALAEKDAVRAAVDGDDRVSGSAAASARKMACGPRRRAERTAPPAPRAAPGSPFGHRAGAPDPRPARRAARRPGRQMPFDSVHAVVGGGGAQLDDGRRRRERVQPARPHLDRVVAGEQDQVGAGDQRRAASVGRGDRPAAPSASGWLSSSRPLAL